MHDYKKIGEWRKLMKNDLTLDDYLVICGDFAITWDPKTLRYLLREVYGNFPCTILWVDGNHENFDILFSQFKEEPWMDGKVRWISDRILHLSRGEIFVLPNGRKIFSFGGAKSTDRGYDTGYNRGWWPQELPTQEEYQNALKNLAKHKSKVDYIFTHDGPPSMSSVITGMWRETDPKFEYMLERFAQTIDFTGWYFGHHHADKSFDKFHCVYNSIIELE
jgi:hypothetical protein